MALSTQHPYDVITIDIIDDNVTECVESFSVDLHFMSEVIDRVALMPSSMNIAIMDDDKSKFIAAWSIIEREKHNIMHPFILGMTVCKCYVHIETISIQHDVYIESGYISLITM